MKAVVTIKGLNSLMKADEGNEIFKSINQVDAKLFRDVKS